MSFKAKYDGWCRECGEPIHAGEELKWDEGVVVHAECVPDADKDEAPRPTCPKCWQVRSVSGACGCDPE